MMEMGNASMAEKTPEESQSVKIVFDMIRDIMWKIRDVDGIDKQQAMALQLFKFLGNATDLKVIATKLMELAMTADNTVIEEEKQEEMDETIHTGLESLYIEQD